MSRVCDSDELNKGASRSPYCELIVSGLTQILKTHPKWRGDWHRMPLNFRGHAPTFVVVVPIPTPVATQC